ncbi:MAG: hypothetical protein ABJA66_12455 [Actinomycetota bacterium]
MPAYYDGERRQDTAVYRPSNGIWFFTLSSTGEVQSNRFGIAEDIPTPAYYDGDRLTGIAVFRQSTGIWYQLNSQTGLNILRFGKNGDIPLNSSLIL